jgi:hypothetical protein
MSKKLKNSIKIRKNYFGLTSGMSCLQKFRGQFEVKLTKTRYLCLSIIWEPEKLIFKYYIINNYGYKNSLANKRPTIRQPKAEV